jgi:hypothetical protein
LCINRTISKRANSKRAELKGKELIVKELYCILYKLLGEYFYSQKNDLYMKTGPPAYNTLNFFWVYIEMLPPPPCHNTALPAFTALAPSVQQWILSHPHILVGVFS